MRVRERADRVRPHGNLVRAISLAHSLQRSSTGPFPPDPIAPQAQFKYNHIHRTLMITHLCAAHAGRGLARQPAGPLSSHGARPTRRAPTFPREYPLDLNFENQKRINIFEIFIAAQRPRRLQCHSCMQRPHSLWLGRPVRWGLAIGHALPEASCPAQQPVTVASCVWHVAHMDDRCSP